MNSFTKEELENILYCVDVVSHVQDDDHEILFNKIQSMIDNYCEHEFALAGCDGNPLAICLKCGHPTMVKFNTDGGSQ